MKDVAYDEEEGGTIVGMNCEENILEEDFQMPQLIKQSSVKFSNLDKRLSILK